MPESKPIGDMDFEELREYTLKLEDVNKQLMEKVQLLIVEREMSASFVANVMRKLSG